VFNSSGLKIILPVFTVCCLVLFFIVQPISQDLLYHTFSDRREIFGIPNFYNVISNIPFVILGVAGLYRLFQKGFDSLAVFTFFVGVTGIGIGSAYYHYNPDNATLVWDRIPMTIAFMSFFIIVLGKYANKTLSSILLFPLLLIGIGSVLSWYLGELSGQGDLRLYALVQFYPMVAIPLILFTYPSPRLVKIEILAVILLYAIAKFFEAFDSEIFSVGEIISGHSLKHLFAAAAIWQIMRIVKNEMNRSPAQ
jgi:hypothetical protein